MGLLSRPTSRLTAMVPQPQHLSSPAGMSMVDAAGPGQELAEIHVGEEALLGSPGPTEDPEGPSGSGHWSWLSSHVAESKCERLNG